MENIDNTKKAEFIIAHGKKICWGGNNFEKSQPELMQQLIDLGATITSLLDYTKTQEQRNVDGPHVMILDETDIRGYGRHNQHWSAPCFCTVFVLPGGSEKIKDMPWRQPENRNHETFEWQNDHWQQLPMQGNQGVMLRPWREINDKLFQQQILGIHPELSIFWDRIYPVYAGALEENVLHKIPLLESVEMIEKAIGNGKDIIIFSNADEALQPQSIHMAHRIVDAIDYMPKDCWYMLTATLDGTQSYEALCKYMEVEPKLNILSGFRFENVIKDSMYMEYPSRSQDFSDHPHWKGREYKIGKRDKKLLCFNRMPRWQRARMLGFLFEHDLIKDSYVSFDLSQHAEVFSNKESWLLGDGINIDEEFKKDPYVNNIYNVWEDLPLVLNRTVNRDNPVDINDDDLQYFDNSYFSVVNETNFYHCLHDGGHRPISCVHSDGVFISEKLYKPIAHRHPFIVAGINRTLQYLRKAGYRTFHPIINEDYDNIVDDEKRLQAIEEEILRLVALTDDEWLDIQEKMKPIIDFNYRHLLSIKPLNTTDFDVVEKLG